MGLSPPGLGPAGFNAVAAEYGGELGVVEADALGENSVGGEELGGEDGAGERRLNDRHGCQRTRNTETMRLAQTRQSRFT